MYKRQNHRRKPTVGRADPPVVPVTDEISPNKNSQLIRGQAFRIVAVIEKLAFHSGPHAFTSSIIVAPATSTVHALKNTIFSSSSRLYLLKSSLLFIPILNASMHRKSSNLTPCSLSFRSSTLRSFMPCSSQI